MKATISGLAAVLVSVCSLNTASAQAPYPVMPAGYGGQGAYAGPVAGAPGGCDCNGGQHGLLGKLGLKHGEGCSAGLKGGCSKCGDGSGLFGGLKGWLCRPYPSTAP